MPSHGVDVVKGPVAGPGSGGEAAGAAVSLPGSDGPGALVAGGAPAPVEPVDGGDGVGGLGEDALGFVLGSRLESKTHRGDLPAGTHLDQDSPVVGDGW